MPTITPYLPQLLVAWTAYIIAAASPGPAIVAIISTSISRSRAGGLAMASGVLTGSYVWALLAAAGLSALIRSYGNALFVLKIAGGLYLLWLAFKALKAAMRKEATADAMTEKQPPSLKRLYMKGLGIHLTNPKAIFSWLTLVSLGTPQDAPHMMPILIGGCMTLGVIIFFGYAVLFSIEPVHRGYRRARRGIEAAMAGFFAFAGFKLLTTQL